jgi:transposase-like protein
MSEHILSPQQMQVIDALSSGATTAHAAAQAGVHRNTISNWRHKQQVFRDALANAHYDRALLVREQYEIRVDRALQTLDELIADPKTPASIRLKAALTILEKASTPPPPQTEVVWAYHHTGFPKPGATKVHNDAQGAPPAPPPSAAPVQPPAHLHNDAQPAPTTIRRESPKLGRNDACPCGSGLKFKRCCLLKEVLKKAA